MLFETNNRGLEKSHTVETLRYTHTFNTNPHKHTRKSADSQAQSIRRIESIVSRHIFTCATFHEWNRCQSAKPNETFRHSLLLRKPIISSCATYGQLVVSVWPSVFCFFFLSLWVLCVLFNCFWVCACLSGSVSFVCLVMCLLLCLCECLFVFELLG